VFTACSQECDQMRARIVIKRITRKEEKRGKIKTRRRRNGNARKIFTTKIVNKFSLFLSHPLLHFRPLLKLVMKIKQSLPGCYCIEVKLSIKNNLFFKNT